MTPSPTAKRPRRSQLARSTASAFHGLPSLWTKRYAKKGNVRKNVGRRDIPASPTRSPTSHGRLLPVASTSAAIRKKTADTWANVHRLPSVTAHQKFVPNARSSIIPAVTRRSHPICRAATQKSPMAAAPTTTDTCT